MCVCVCVCVCARERALVYRLTEDIDKGSIYTNVQQDVLETSDGAVLLIIF